jgi:anti-sigma factor RsiW
MLTEAALTGLVDLGMDPADTREVGAAFLAAQDRDALTHTLWEAMDDRGIDVGLKSCRAGIDALLGPAT